LELEPTGFDRVQIGVDGIGEDVRPGESPGRVKLLANRKPQRSPPANKRLNSSTGPASTETAQPLSLHSPSSTATLSRKPVDSTGSWGRIASTPGVDIEGRIT